MKRLYRYIVGSTIAMVLVGLLIFGGRWTTGAELETPPVQVAPTLLPASEVQELLVQKGLTGLIGVISASPTTKLPEIHTQPYCASLPQAEQDSCSAANAVGQQIYSELRAYPDVIKALPPERFAAEIHKLAVLRDRLWQTRSIGGILLVDLSNRIIFWCLTSRMTTGPLDELERLDAMRIEYKDLISDWRTVAESCALELNTKIDYVAIEDTITKARKPKRNDWRVIPNKSALSLRYLDIADQLEPKMKTINSDIPGVMSIPGVLKTGKFSFILASYVAGACQSALRPNLLLYYSLLMQKIRVRKEFSIGLIRELTPTSNPALKAAQLKSAKESQQSLRSKYEELVPQLIPKALETKIDGCQRPLSANDFHRVTALVEYQINMRLQYGAVGDDAAFESHYP